METKDVIEVLSTLGMIGNSEKTGYEKYVGENLFIRTVTHHYTGKCVETTNMTMTLETAAWIADDGRFNESVKTGNFSEVEPYAAPVTINLSAILDVTTVPILSTVVK